MHENNTDYFIHIRTSFTLLPWQYYQGKFSTNGNWQDIRLDLSEFSGSGIFLPKNIKSEFKFSKDTRFDFLCDKKLLEVKNVTLTRKYDFAEFPDSVTTRGSKHLNKLIDSIDKNYEPYVLFLTQIQGINNFRIAKDIDNDYYQNYLKAKKAGVKFLAYRCHLSSKEIKIEKKIKIVDE